MAKIVLDTNVVVRLLSSRVGILTLTKLSIEHQIYSSKYLNLECERILRTKFNKTSQYAKVVVGRFARLTTIVVVDEVPIKLMRDPTDEPILALCHQHKVDYFVSDDLDFSTDLLTPVKLLRSSDFREFAGLEEIV
jgi:putative PIN family toxin of toxin-antitoxin system